MTAVVIFRTPSAAIGKIAIQSGSRTAVAFSCHGPGGDHVAADAGKLGTIVSLGDKCDSCVILQICGACHDDANDPGFAFEVEDKIEIQRHGTIEAGTGRPLEDAARLQHTRPELLAGQALRSLGE